MTESVLKENVVVKGASKSDNGDSMAKDSAKTNGNRNKRPDRSKKVGKDIAIKNKKLYRKR